MKLEVSQAIFLLGFTLPNGQSIATAKFNVLHQCQCCAQVSVQWWIVVDHYAEQPVLPELPLLAMQSGAYKADIKI